ncbi:LacI family DNA-binding transcriptional regulator [Bengtsoniella intestinalis]|uniref:LacI family DNA-binding transcriptional regulator n=1 Tax=Bengtsoniella intestinalis TaxID=3073143 RepID=UPI00391F12FC
MATIKDVAKEAGVHISTVSRTLGGAYYVEPSTRERVMQAVEKLGYKPNPIAKGLKEGRTRIIGYVVPRVNDSVFSQISQSISQACVERDYMVILCCTGEDTKIEADYYNRMKGKWVDGFIIGTANDDNRALLESLKAENIPVVLVTRSIENAFNAVLSDNVEGARQAAKHLIANGCKRILFLNGNLKLELCRERLKGYQQGLMDEGIPFDQSLVCNDIAMQWAGAISPVKGTVTPEQAVAHIVSQNIEFDAVLGITDAVAAGAMTTLKNHGITIPDQVKIMGMGDLEIASFTDPPLTTMHQSADTIGRRSVELLLEQIESRDFTAKTLEKLPFTLVVRETV